MKNKTCRLIITTDCVFNCPYCCNRLPDVQKQFRMTTVGQIARLDYETFCITGGEPFLALMKLEKVCAEIGENKKIFIYTTGTEFSSVISIMDVIKYEINGFNIGIHQESFNHKKQIWYFLENILYYWPNTTIRLQIQDKKENEFLRKDDGWLVRTTHQFGARIQLWKMNDCDVKGEDWLIC